MTNEDNDLLLQQFFSEAAGQQIDDNGFTERVMQSLPKPATLNAPQENAERVAVQSLFRVRRISRLWTAFCIVVFMALFVLSRGWELLAVHFEVMLRTLAAESFSINLLTLAAAMFGLLFVGVGEVIVSETARR